MRPLPPAGGNATSHRVALSSSLTSSFLPFQLHSLQTLRLFFLWSTLLDSYSEPHSSCFFLGFVQVPESFRRGGRVHPVPTSSLSPASPCDAGSKGTVSEESSPGRSLIVYLFVLCIWALLFLFSKMLPFLFLGLFLQESVLLTLGADYTYLLNRVVCTDA